jgi:KamA family protein
LQGLDRELLHGVRVASAVFPFRVNSYILDHLIDWKNIPNDPIFQLVFPQKEMLEREDFDRLSPLVHASSPEVKGAVRSIQERLNPHPGDQMTLNVPTCKGTSLKGMQHKYRQTVLFFPKEGQYCASYCTFCFRWAQFVGNPEWIFSSRDMDDLCGYLREHTEVTDLLFTGGDPLIMSTELWKRYLLPLLDDPTLGHLQNIRIGTKMLTYWPQRFVTQPDADELMRLFEQVIRSGKHLSIVAHYNHWKELEPEIAQKAIRRLQNIGVVIRGQGPVLRHINDDPKIWSRLWNEQVRLGIVPYYMLVERDTGPKHYFEVPLERAWAIYKIAAAEVSGLGRTVRGPVMSTSPGKVEIIGMEEVAGERVFVLRFHQARFDEWLHRPFFAKASSNATWLNHLEPAFGQSSFFFEES